MIAQYHYYLIIGVNSLSYSGLKYILKFCLLSIIDYSSKTRKTKLKINKIYKAFLTKGCSTKYLYSL